MKIKKYTGNYLKNISIVPNKIWSIHNKLDGVSIMKKLNIENQWKL